MRLSSLKISGFKSFADKTTLHFKANRSAIVGPNGCGKSNVIDAIRWVMGESSARQLRGGNMQDVIFTGTAKRKPVGMASVELKFDNTEGKLGGQYGAYTELAVRRQVTREGKSEYFLNGTRCRRRDITDIFLGTGLGPRSYAIIEQGMINRLVDAKPDDMRVFIEEAAGISKYQARRKETLQHLEHTSQNLARLEDIASELNHQLKTLKRQSESALKHSELSQAIHQHKVDILSFQCQQSQQQQQQHIAEMDILSAQFKQARINLKETEEQLSQRSQLFQKLLEQSSPLQQQWQTADQKRLHMSLQLEQQQKEWQQYTTQLTALQQQYADVKQQIKHLDIQLDDAYANQEPLQQQCQQLKQQQQQLEQDGKTTEQDYKQVAEDYQNIKQQYVQYQQQQQQLQNQLEQLDKNLLRMQHQQETMLSQTQRMQCSEQESCQSLQQQHQDALSHVALTEKILQDDASKLEQIQKQTDDAKHQHDELNIQLKALTVEQSHLSKRMQKRAGASSEHTLLQALQLQPQAKPYANLIEQCLANWLGADVLTTEQAYQSNIARQIKVHQTIQTMPNTQKTLATWVQEPQWSWLDNIWLADDLNTALTQQAQLQTGQSILTLDGYHVGVDWLIALSYDNQAQHAGILSDRVRFEQIEEQIIGLKQQVQQHADVLKGKQETLQQHKQVIQAQQLQLKQQQAQAQTLGISVAKAQSTEQAQQQQKQQLAEQVAQLNVQIEEDRMQKDDLEIDCHALGLKIERLAPQYQTLQQQYNDLEQQQEQSREQQRVTQQQYLQLHQQMTDHQRQVELLEKDLAFAKMQQVQLKSQIDSIQPQLNVCEQQLPQQQEDYDAQHQYVQTLQKKWDAWQLELNTAQSEQNALTEQRHVQEQQEQQLREKLEAQRLAWHQAKSDYEHFSEQLSTLDPTALPEANIDLAQHQANLKQLQQRFEKLGPVNLAASEEYLEVQERYEVLKHQIDDLEQSGEQLKQAMKSIDQETKKRFMSTFDQVNAELKQLFPKVFHGGEASLSLEEDWQSGVKLMARPPGKRNSSLALLSGGEKALTALALVFAIFRLNPAPFCVLDEVDAPLDDANVQRFCNLVKELSEQVQFVYITHNKLAMTMATDLLGVTMPEPGTSALVTVNLEQAKEHGLVAES
ncbi:chromosome segregation protein SMC [Acinetobacter rathckeae]|uniref:chromosome segregation protein SMC n=1 Tax=Acinetobacter rathckeae TaxID=2605272 RepID=UPI0018A266F5|nr:chromosome segregation protein SMC [Acinetobacter rathckeae]MBF7695659.1 chromosome segregation protein SMC [Acinetobacter rathckeae]